MYKQQIIKTLVILCSVIKVSPIHLHNFYALQRTDVVSTSSSIRQMNICKDQCLSMGKYFPFKFKYHRYILRETVGSNKYFQGTCLFNIQGDSQWYGWEKLRVFIMETNQVIDQSEVQRWTNFKDKCEDQTLKMDQETLDNLNFQRVHSNFEYFDDGTFNNVEPFTDLDSLMNSVSGLIK